MNPKNKSWRENFGCLFLYIVSVGLRVRTALPVYDTGVMKWIGQEWKGVGGIYYLVTTTTQLLLCRKKEKKKKDLPCHLYSGRYQ